MLGGRTTLPRSLGRRWFSLFTPAPNFTVPSAPLPTPPRTTPPPVRTGRSKTPPPPPTPSPPPRKAAKRPRKTKSATRVDDDPPMLNLKGRITKKQKGGKTVAVEDAEVVEARMRKYLNEEQQKAFHRVVVEGRSSLIIGAAGTGKSHATRTICNGLFQTGRAVAACAPFGVAACNINGFTVHTTFGLMSQQIDTLKSLDPSSREFKRLRDKILSTCAKRRSLLWDNLKVLLIDEISTLDRGTFDLLDYMARTLRQNNAPFGGIQVIAVGDFLQLPPVKGDWVFKSDAFCELFDNSLLELRTILRQSDRPFLDALNSVRTLHPDDHASRAFAQAQLKRACNVVDELGSMPKSICLVPRRDMAEKQNQAQLGGLKTEAHKFTAIDTPAVFKADLATLPDGSSLDVPSVPRNLNALLDALLKNHRLASELTLKKGARVMNLHNTSYRGLGRSSSMVANGHTGTVKDFRVPENDEVTESYEKMAQELGRVPLPVVQWDHTSQLSLITPVEIEVGDYLQTACHVRSRVQLPLALSWAITAHKCQGMTIEGDVAVDLSRCFSAGQAYVALSRSKSGRNTFIRGLQAGTRGLCAHPEALEFVKAAGGA